MLREVLLRAVRQVWRDRRVTFIVVGSLTIAGTAASLLLAAVSSFLSVRIAGVDVETLIEGFQVFRGVRYAWSLPLVDVFEQSAVHAQYAGISFFPKTINTRSGPARVWFESVTTTYADVLRIRPEAGRWFRSDENLVPLRDDVAVFSDELCRRVFSSVDRCVGQRIPVADRQLLIVGAMPGGFRGIHGNTDAWVPLMLAPLGIGLPGRPFPFWTSPTSHWMALVGRVRSTNDIKAAQSELRAIYEAYAAAHGWQNDSTPQADRSAAELRTLRDARIDPHIDRAGRVVDAAVAALLVMTCINATLLLIAQVTRRIKDLAIRLTLGASTRRVVGELTCEAVVIGVGAAACAGVLALLTSRAVEAMMQDSPEARLAGLEVSLTAWRSAIATSAGVVGVAIAALVVFSALIAWRVVRADLTIDVLLRHAAVHTGIRRWQGALLSLQVASAVALAIGGGLLASSYRRTIGEPTGFTADHVLTVRLPPSINRSPDDVLVAARSVGGIRHVARIECLPLSRACLGTAVTRGDGDGQPTIEVPAVLNRVDPDGLEILHIAVRQGRALSSRDNAMARKTIVISQSLADRLGPHALDARLDVAGVGLASVVGVVDDVKYDGLTEATKPTAYVPWDQRPPPDVHALILEADAAPDALARSVRDAFIRSRPELAAAEIIPLATALRNASTEQRLQVIILAAFGLIAVLMCATGVAGLTRFVVTNSLRELGIRLALGASPSSVVRLVVTRIAAFLLMGAVAGVAAAILGRGWLAPLLYGVSPMDPTAFCAGALGVSAAVLLSATWVARGAARIDSALTLRAE